MELPWPLKGLSNEDVAWTSETLRVCIAVQPTRATGIECCVHVRAIAREVFASAGIVGVGRVVDGAAAGEDEVETKFGRHDDFSGRR